MSTTLVESQVNIDLFTWTTREAAPGGGYTEVHHTAARGETVSLPALDAERGRALQVRRHYARPDGTTWSRPEPALLEPGVDLATLSAGDAERLAELEAQIAALRGTALGTPVSTTPTEVAPVTLPPSVLGASLMPSIAPDGSQVAGDEVPDFTAMDVAETLAWLNQHPDGVEALAAAEGARATPRSSVTKAIETLRAAS